MNLRKRVEKLEARYREKSIVLCFAEGNTTEFQIHGSGPGFVDFFRRTLIDDYSDPEFRRLTEEIRTCVSYTGCGHWLDIIRAGLAPAGEELRPRPQVPPPNIRPEALGPMPAPPPQEPSV
jgi:hypothetical protein